MRRLTFAASLSLALAMPAFAGEPPKGPLSPACALLTPSVAEAWGRDGGEARDGGPAQYGMSNCSWYGPQNAMLVVTLMEGDQIAGMGGPEKTFDMYLKSFGAGMKAEPETLEGIGDKAVLLLEGDPAMQSAVLMILKGERVVSISLSMIDRDTAIAVGGAVAANF